MTTLNKKISHALLCVLATLSLPACAEKAPKQAQTPSVEAHKIETTNTPTATPKTDKPTVETTPQTTAKATTVAATPKTSIHPDFVSIKELSGDIVLDIKYATPDNFLKQSVYECGECFLRKETAQALAKVNAELMQKGYRIKVFDCYRPLSVQRKMWKIMPNTPYVANPAKGSKHNRGAAVDLTLVTLDGKELDMGTPFDFFGQKAHHGYKNLPKNVLANRTLLKSSMEKHNFSSISSEWWHYDYKPLQNAKVENFTWDCAKK